MCEQEIVFAHSMGRTRRSAARKLYKLYGVQVCVRHRPVKGDALLVRWVDAKGSPHTYVLPKGGNLVTNSKQPVFVDYNVFMRMSYR